MCKFSWVYRYVVVWVFVCPGMCNCGCLMIVSLCTYYTHTDTPAGYMCLIKGQVEYEYVMVSVCNGKFDAQCVYVLGEWWVTQGREFQCTMSYSSGMVARGNRLAWLCWGWGAQNFWTHGPHLPLEWDCVCARAMTVFGNLVGRLEDKSNIIILLPYDALSLSLSLPSSNPNVY